MKIWRKGLLVPIIILLAVIALSMLVIGHWIGVAGLRYALEAREEDRLVGINASIKAMIDAEAARLKTLSGVIQKNPLLAEALAAGDGSGAARLEAILDDLYSGLNVDILTITDARGQSVYSLEKGREKVDLSDLWGMDEALEGEEMVSTDQEERGFAIRAISIPPQRLACRIENPMISGRFSRRADSNSSGGVARSCQFSTSTSWPRAFSAAPT